MEQKKIEVTKRLNELNKISFVKPTAMDLRSSRPMLARVQRKEENRFKAIVEKQKLKLKEDLKKIEEYSKYLKNKSNYEAYLRRQREYLNSVKNRNNFIEQKNDLVNKGKSVGMLGLNLPEVLPIPSQVSNPGLCDSPQVIMGQRPILRKARIRLYQRGRRY